MDSINTKVNSLNLDKEKTNIYVCTKASADDANATGSIDNPFSSLQSALSAVLNAQASDRVEEDRCATSKSSNNSITLPENIQFLIKKEGDKESSNEEAEWMAAPKSALKKALNYHQILQKKAAKASAKKEAEDSSSTKSEGKKSTQQEQKELILDTERPWKTLRISDCLGVSSSAERVCVRGWVHRMRAQGKNMIFLTLRDGSGFLQCLLDKAMCSSPETSRLIVESTIELWGHLQPVPEGKVAPGGHELSVDHWRLVHAAPGGSDAFETRLNKEANPDVLFDQRHLVIRGDVASAVLKARSYFLQAFRAHYSANDYCELTTPCLTQTECEGGSTLFALKDYYGQPAYLTQSSQLYLETAIPSLGDVFCIQMSFRAEASRTRRHLSEFTHIEAECPWISFDELVDRIESLVCDVIEWVLASPQAAALVHELNPGFAVPKRPFKRMQYKDAIEWLRTHDYRKEDGSHYAFGEDIPEKPERFMVDTIGEPIFLCRFPAEMKAFYMEKDPNDPILTLSTDLLMPGVGEIVGGSMRLQDYDQLLKGYAREGIDPTNYYWYTDQRKYGSCPHGGYGLGFERFLAWALGRDHVRDVCLYPRYVKRCTP